MIVRSSGSLIYFFETHIKLLLVIVLKYFKNLETNILRAQHTNGKSSNIRPVMPKMYEISCEAQHLLVSELCLCLACGFNESQC